MPKEDNRKNIKANREVFEAFSERCHVYGMTQSEMLQSLLQKEVVKTSTTMVNRCEGDFDNLCKRESQKAGENKK